MIKAAIIVISDSCSAGEREDESGIFLQKKMEEAGWSVVNYLVIPDQKDLIKESLSKLAGEVDVILTSGGTGLGERDVTPEATREILEKEVPGISEAMRMQTFAKTPYSVLSRGISGVKNQTLIINLPGSLKGVKESLEVVLPVIPHAVEIIKGSVHHHEKSQ